MSTIDVHVGRQPGRELTLHYSVTGHPGGLRIPATSASGRADELWRHTCFEAFLRAPAQDSYYEFNFSPSLQWAAYRFDAYRSGMRAVQEFAGPCIEVGRDDNTFELRVVLNLAGLSGFDEPADWRLGLSAVIEEKNGNVSYWALAHPPGKPDFHHADNFALRLLPVPISGNTHNRIG